MTADIGVLRAQVQQDRDHRGDRRLERIQLRLSGGKSLCECPADRFAAQPDAAGVHGAVLERPGGLMRRVEQHAKENRPVGAQVDRLHEHPDPARGARLRRYVRKLEVDAPLGHSHEDVDRDVFIQRGLEQCVQQGLVDPVDALRHAPRRQGRDLEGQVRPPVAQRLRHRQGRVAPLRPLRFLPAGAAEHLVRGPHAGKLAPHDFQQGPGRVWARRGVLHRLLQASCRRDEARAGRPSAPLRSGSR